nr:peptidoglycan-binding protein [Tissierella sp.]
MLIKKKTIKNTIVACTLAGIITLGGTASQAALGDRALYQGVNHPDVKELQQELRKGKFFNHKNNTTYFGNITKQAVKRFQKANGLKADGSFGPASARVLKGKTNTQAKPPVSNNSSVLSYSRALRRGAKGNDVRDLQLALKKLGHYNGSVDASFGPGTSDAVKSFQRAQGLPVNGNIASSTVRIINEVLTGKIAAGKPTPATPNRNDSGKSTTINIINTAKKFIGGRYVYGGSSPSGFDCSGFTQYVYSQMGINIPRATGSQASAGTRVSKSDLEPGDLLIFSNTYKAGPSHAGVYLGNGQFIHAANPSKGIRLDSINSGYYNGKFSYGRRVY